MRSSRSIFTRLLGLACVFAALSQSALAEPLSVVSDVDLSRYTGTWYEIARLPNSFQKKCESNVTANYKVLEDKQIEVLNRCKTKDNQYSEAEGRAKKADEKGSNAKLKVRFAPAWLSWLGFVWGDYWILELAPDYSYSVVGEPSLKYFWILSRTKTMDDQVYKGILERAKKQGFDVSKIVKTKQEAQ